jgi:hypothetical protein
VCCQTIRKLPSFLAFAGVFSVLEIISAGALGTSALSVMALA